MSLRERTRPWAGNYRAVPTVASEGPAFRSRLDSVMVGRGLLLLGFVCLAVVVLTHVAEWLRVFPGMGWACEVALVITSILSVLYLAARF
jgi:hypothetical protein